jgi:hypothetical protein
MWSAKMHTSSMWRLTIEPHEWSARLQHLTAEEVGMLGWKAQACGFRHLPTILILSVDDARWVGSPPWEPEQGLI